MIRLTWVQPEDLIGHELRQAAEDGRHPADGGDGRVARIAERWHAAGGHDAPPRAGASTGQAAHLRGLAEDLLDELAAIPSPLAEQEPSDLAGITAHWPAERPGRVPVDRERILAAWQGRAAGCVLGKPVEKLPREAIREIAEATGNWPLRSWFTAEGLPEEIARRWPWNRRSAVNSLAENIDGIPEDDDLNYPLLALSVLRRHGREFTTEQVAGLWLDELPAGRTFTAERVAYRNLLDGLEIPQVATYRNPFREWIGALIRTDVYGWTNPGDPWTAAEHAWRDARLTHTANGLYGAMFAAAMCARSLAAGSALEVVEAGLAVIPPASRLARAVRQAVEDASSLASFEEVVDRLYQRHGHLHWVHTINNAAVVAAALVHARDFTTAIAGAVAAGWDTDSAGATAGSVAGALWGVPEQWRMRDSLASSLTGFDGISLTELGGWTHDLGLR
ncbi:ADP-ribosylglycohydrolase family protein [Nonomuraea sp. NPDC050310]|uniref:ADP-ribosylglycohydrolase family protein n=1 Tax=Nonomuraea sp. NPDC050310 TaxID=3154935 RepID=UPI0033D065E5